PIRRCSHASPVQAPPSNGRVRRSAAFSTPRSKAAESSSWRPPRAPAADRRGEMDPADGASPQRRAFPRIPLRAKARMEFAEQRYFLSEWAVNLSPGGMFVRSEAPMTAGQRFHFDASLTPRGPVFSGVGEVMWVRHDWEGGARPPGFAVRFIEIDEQGRATMIQLAQTFIEKGAAAMQEELRAMATEWYQRLLAEE